MEHDSVIKEWEWERVLKIWLTFGGSRCQGYAWEQKQDLHLEGILPNWWTKCSRCLNSRCISKEIQKAEMYVKIEVDNNRDIQIIKSILGFQGLLFSKEIHICRTRRSKFAVFSLNYLKVKLGSKIFWKIFEFEFLR